MIAACDAACQKARVLHWPLVFPEVFQKGGFDCILTNPPWDQIQLNPVEWFGSRDESISNAETSAKRDKMIAGLRNSNPLLFAEYENAKDVICRQQEFIHSSGRYLYGCNGRLNLASVFVENVINLTNESGRMGLIVPIGICTDSFNQELFRFLVQHHHLESFYGFENEEKLFDGVHHSFKFALVTLSATESADFSFFNRSVIQLADERKHFSLTSDDFSLINPNTLTAPIFRTKADAELSKSIYSRLGVFVNENLTTGNPWGVRFKLMFMMNSDSGLFETSPLPDTLPLYEAKMMHQYDHRWATYEGMDVRDVSSAEKQNPLFEVSPHFWVAKSEVDQKLDGFADRYIMAWRKVTNAIMNRTTFATVMPYVAAGDSLILFSTQKSDSLSACLLADMNSLVHDWCARQKLGGMNLSYLYVYQMPIIPPNRYSPSDIDYIVPRVLELTYTSYSLKGWAEALGYEGEPFVFDPERRAVLRAELDARYAKLYGLNEQELTYILDPSAVYGPDYPSESFRVLKEKEIAEFGEYRTMRMVLEAWKAQETNIAVSERYKRNAESWDQERSTYLRLLVGQMVAQSPTHSIPIEDLFGAFSALRTPKVMSELEQMPVVVKEWVTQYKDFVRDDESLDNVLAEMFDAEEISISKTGIVSFVDEGGLHAADSLRDVVIDASLSLAFWKLVKSSALVSRCRNELPLVFWQKIAEGYYARTA